MAKLGFIEWAAMLLAVLLPVLAAGCQSGGSLPEPRLTVDVPAELVAGATAAWTVSWENFGTGPYTVAMDMGGGMSADLPDTSTAASPFTYTFTPVIGDYAQTQSYTYSVLVADARGEILSAGGSYEVYTPPPGQPAVDEVNYEHEVLTVTASSPAEIPLTVTVTEPPSLVADCTSKVVEGGASDVVFYWSATDIIAGEAEGETTITVSDDYGGTDTATALIDTYVHPAVDGELIAVPDKTEAKVGEPLMVVVICSSFSDPFYALDWIEISLNQGAEYIDGSFNAGVPGGEPLEPDGAWSRMNPRPDALLGGIMNGMEPDYLPERFSFNFSVVPIGGSDTSSGGALFCFELKFTRPGNYTLSIVEGQGEFRTHFSDRAGNDYYWADISNDYPNVPNSITVL